MSVKYADNLMGTIMPLSKQSYDAYCRRDTVQVLHSETYSGQNWTEKLLTHQNIRLVEVLQGITNAHFHLIDPVASVYIADQQNSRFSSPLKSWVEENGTIQIPHEQVYQEETALIIGGMKNHWHFLINFLPRLIMARKIMGSSFEDLDCVVIHEATPMQQDFLERLFPDVVFRQIPAGSTAAYGFKSMFYLDFPKNTLLCPEILSLTRAVVLEAYEPRPTDLAAGIFVDRNPDIPRRRLAGRANKLAIFEEHGITPIFCEDYNFSQQIALFHGADFVAGLHGAGMSNILFCRVGTPVLIIDYKWPSEMYALAQALDLRPLPILAEKVYNKTVEMRLRDLEITPKQLDAALTALKALTD
ncbi:glycosyltransferase family 61 protein [Sulfitobacter sp. HNIBRBA3233]|uniref:glycosyltransferase family 61 protein n=1 Tax=Sulfitobacter marinivivus TaxID=3158558 RepID=UPI0032DF251A